MPITGNSEGLLAPVGAGGNFGEVVALPGGGYVAIWTQLVTLSSPVAGTTDTAGQAIFGRRFDADGASLGNVFQVNQTVEGFQSDPSVTVMENGNLAVAWAENPGIDGEDARAIVITPDGAPVGDEILLGQSQDDDQRVPAVAPVDGGGFVAVWEDDSLGRRAEDYWNGQVFGADGVATGPQFTALISELSTEASVLVPFQAPSGETFYTLAVAEPDIFDPTFNLDLFSYEAFDRTFTYPENQYEGMPSLGFREDDAVNLGDGFVARIDPEGVGNIFDPLELNLSIYAARDYTGLLNNSFPDPDRTERPDPQVGLQELTSITVPYADLGPTGGNLSPAAAGAATPDGDLLLVWSQTTGGTELDPEISLFAQVIGKSGALLTDRIEVATDLAGTQLAPPFVDVGADGRAFIGWTTESGRTGAGSLDLAGDVYTITLPDRSATTTGDDYTVGTADDDTFEGSGGADTIFGRDGDDLFIQDDDTILSGDTEYGRRNDTWNGGTGDDHFLLTRLGSSNQVAPDITYGLGEDTLDYSGVSTGLSGPNTERPSDNIFDPQRVIGSLHDDVLSFSASYNFTGNFVETQTNRISLHAEAGDDLINLSPRFMDPDFVLFDKPVSDFVVDGGTGNDTLAFNSQPNYTRDSFQLEKLGDTYRLARLFENDAGNMVPDTQAAVELRSIEQIEFADETVTLDPTPTVESGAGGVTEEPRDDIPSSLRVTLTSPDGAAVEGVMVTFTPEDGPARAPVISTATGQVELELPAEATGRLEASRAYDPDAGDPTISALDALDVLRLAVGIAPSFGDAQTQNYIAADINTDGAVTALDALEVLRAAVGIDSANAPRWAFFDATTDWDSIPANGAAVNAPETGIDLSAVTPGADLGMTGILLGNMDAVTGPGSA